jgi:WD40 repeat protein
LEKFKKFSKIFRKSRFYRASERLSKVLIKTYILCGDLFVFGQKLLGHWNGVHTTVLSPSGKHIISGGGDGVIKIWKNPLFKKPGLYTNQQERFCHQDKLTLEKPIFGDIKIFYKK